MAKGSHCVVFDTPTELVGIDAAGKIHSIPLDKGLSVDGELIGDAGAATSEVRCFATLEEAIHHATMGWVNLPSGTKVTDLTDELLNSKLSPKTTTVIAIDYDGTSYTSSSYTHSVSNSHGCQTYGCGFLGLQTCWYSYGANLPSDWNDRVSSTKGFADCNENVLFENSNYGGSKLTCTPNCTSLGVMNNAASSRKWCRTGESYCD